MRFNAEMDYCASHGIPHSVFLAWSTDDQDKAIAWMFAGRAKCPGCGTYPDDWLTEDGQDLDDAPFEAQSILCNGCRTLAEAREEIPDDRAHMYHVYLVPSRRVPLSGDRI